MADDVIITNINKCSTCRNYPKCEKAINCGTDIMINCDEWTPIPDYLGVVKTLRTHVHTCPCCNQKFWD